VPSDAEIEASSERDEQSLVGTLRQFFGMRGDAGATRIANSDQVVNKQVASRP
jgi:hypothetical protein